MLNDPEVKRVLGSMNGGPLDLPKLRRLSGYPVDSPVTESAS
jgi:hypothetical protein